MPHMPKRQASHSAYATPVEVCSSELTPRLIACAPPRASGVSRRTSRCPHSAVELRVPAPQLHDRPVAVAQHRPVAPDLVDPDGDVLFEAALQVAHVGGAEAVAARLV